MTLTLTFEGLVEGNKYSFVPEYFTTFTATETKRLVPYLNTEVFEYVEGDFSGNSKLDAEDAAVLVDHLLTGALPEGAEAEAFDVNGDKKADISDIVSLIEKILNSQQ